MIQQKKRLHGHKNPFAIKNNELPVIVKSYKQSRRLQRRGRAGPDERRPDKRLVFDLSITDSVLVAAYMAERQLKRRIYA